MSNDSNNTEAVTKVVGVGGGGINIVENLSLMGLKETAFVAIDTDEISLKHSAIAHKLLLTANHSTEELTGLLDKSMQVMVIVACLGGDTGNSVAPVLARMARESGVLTLGIVTVPFAFEGEHRSASAHAAVAELQKEVDSVVIIPNDVIVKCDGENDLALTESYKMIDSTVTGIVKALNNMLTVEGYVSLDINDLRSTLRNGGETFVGIGTGSGEKRITKAIDNLLATPLGRTHDISHASRVITVLYASDYGNVNMSEIDELRQFFNNSLSKDADIIWSFYIDDSLEDAVGVTLIASGFDKTE